MPKLSALNGDLIAELRQMIFRSCQGVCLPAEQLREIYKSGKEESLSPTRLAHIVSCQRCLDVVNQLLDLPLLEERCNGASNGSNEPPRNNNGNGSSDGPVDLRTKCQKRLKRVVEHKPQELRISVNGTQVSSLKVNSDLNELSLNIAEEETIEFVEVLSEQNLQLLFFSVGDAYSSERDQWATVELSEGRSLEATLQHGKKVRIVYREPVLAEAARPLTLVTENRLSTISAFSRLSVVWELLRSRIAGNSDLTELSLFGEISPKVSKSLLTRPAFVTVLLLAALTGSYLLFRPRVTPTPIAARLLEQASQAEDVVTRTPELLTHRVIGLEERNSAGVLVARRKIETWENSQGNFAQRLYDDTNHLLAGSWQEAEGSRTVYHHESGSRVHASPIKSDSLLLNPEDVWQLKLSAKEFKTLIALPEQAYVIEQPASYILSYNNARQIGASRLLKATLTLNRPNLRAVEQTLLIERGNEVREYRFSETSFERLTQKDVAARVFEPDVILERRASIAKRADATTGSVVPHSLPSLAAASAELEVDVAYLINQAKGDDHEQISLSRTGDGLLHVEGVVDTEQRKNDFIRALSPVSNNPLVKIEILTITEALQLHQSKSSSEVSVRELEETVNTIAVDRELRNYLSSPTETSRSKADLDEAVRSFSSRTVNRAYRALFHAIELKRLVNRFAKVDMHTVTPEARTKWLQMVREHAAAFERETITLRQDLQPVFSSSSGSIPTAGESEISNDADLAQAVERIHKLALANNDAIRSAFTISSQSSSAAIKSPQFWQALNTAAALAARIKQYDD